MSSPAWVNESRMLQTLFEQSLIAIAVLEGPRHTFKFANPAYHAIVGTQDLLGKELLVALPELRGQGFDRLLDRVLATGVPFDGVEVAVKLAHHAADEWLYVNMSYQPKRDEAGIVDGVLVTAVDVTLQVLARQRVELAAAQVRASEERLRRVVDISGAGLWDLELATGAMESDGRMRVLMGLGPTQRFDLMSGLAQLPVEDQVRVNAALQAVAAGANDALYDIEFRTGGTGGAPERWVESRAKLDLGTDGRRWLRGSMIDITARKQAESAANSRTEFERQLIGIVSHDLRAPLSTISLGTSLLLEREGSDEKTLRTLTRIKTAADRGARLVNDLLDFTQARVGGGIPVVKAAGNLHTVVRQVVEDAVTLAPDRELQVTSSGNGHGAWDLDRMGQAVTNLVANAVKYSLPSSLITVTSHAAEDGITVSVHNVGAPIAEAAQARIFQPMQRATSQLENKARSVGLGLYIVKHLVEAHGGTVAVASTAAAGTTFSFWVPKRRLA